MSEQVPRKEQMSKKRQRVDSELMKALREKNLSQIPKLFGQINDVN
jgi:hypothetical protein